ncbi:DUF4328 domain-containing protein [Corallococcus terminator]|uniref:DUF4328 domain-containing protein n=1 Tax=Corallococcus terminator TaxID=2316733 RepID=A0A3A8J2P7_9BACT|nr:DUF4328 domain-containing protein [Corallococcus terminator]RKG86250.1 DUF4328 domain-containing protein [Corallococcus terminator]
MLNAVEGEVESQPMCPSHPAREAVRTCERCGRYVCSWCEREGGQCRECSRQAALAVPDSRVRARRATWALGISAAITALSLPLGLWVVFGPEGGVDLDAMRVLYARLGIVSGVMDIAAQVFFLMWLHRVVRQLKAWGQDIGTSPAWAVAFWFIPFASLVKPYQIVKAIAEQVGGTFLAASLPLSLWWGTNILARLLNRMEQQTFDKAGTIEGAPASAGYAIGLGTTLCSVVTVVCCIQILRVIQEQLDRRRAGMEAPYTPLTEEDAPVAE